MPLSTIFQLYRDGLRSFELQDNINTYIIRLHSFSAWHDKCIESELLIFLLWNIRIVDKLSAFTKVR